MEKLFNLIGTKYLTWDFRDDLKQVLSSVEEVDLAGCKFTPPCEQVLRKFYGTVHMINSRDERLNKILEHNTYAKSIEPIESVPLDVNIRSIETFKDVLKNLSTDLVYDISQYSTAPRKCEALVTAITLKRPEIKIDLGSYIKIIFDFVRESWLKLPKHHDKYWMLSGQALMEVEVHNGCIQLENGGYVTEKQFVQMNCVLPIEFGTEVLIFNEEFRSLWSDCVRILDMKEKKEKHMKDYLGG